jgi:hypothetical protein
VGGCGREQPDYVKLRTYLVAFRAPLRCADYIGYHLGCMHRKSSVEGGVHLSVSFDIDVFDCSRCIGRVVVRAGSAGRRRREGG